MSRMRRLLLAAMSCTGGLPSGYRELKGIVMNSDTYYEIPGFKLTGNDTLRLQFTPRVACNVAGCYHSTNATNNYSIYVTAQNGNYMRYNGGSYPSQVVYDTRHNVVVGPTGSTGFVTNGTWTAESFVATNDFCIGTTSTGATSAKFDGIMHGAIIVEGRARFVPCERLSDHTIGYYETMAGVFYAPVTGSPTEET